MSSEEHRYLDWRGVEQPCAACRGTGWKMYANTSTWRGGIGGNAMTRGQCDRCWGSGDEDRPWTNLRQMEERHAKERARSALADLIAACVGPRKSPASSDPDVRGLVVALEKIGRGDVAKKDVSTIGRMIADYLAKALARGLSAAG